MRGVHIKVLAERFDGPIQSLKGKFRALFFNNVLYQEGTNMMVFGCQWHG